VAAESKALRLAERRGIAAASSQWCLGGERERREISSTGGHVGEQHFAKLAQLSKVGGDLGLLLLQLHTMHASWRCGLLVPLAFLGWRCGLLASWRCGLLLDVIRPLGGTSQACLKFRQAGLRSHQLLIVLL